MSVVETLDKTKPSGQTTMMPRLVAGTMTTTDLATSKVFYEKFLGFDCVVYAHGRMLVRDQYARAAMEAGSEDYFVVEVVEVEKITHPQTMFNHWGIDVDSKEQVDYCFAAAKAHQNEFGIRKVLKITNVHNSYTFYFADHDSNWWEIECRLTHGLNNKGFFAQGDMVGDA